MALRRRLRARAARGKGGDRPARYRFERQLRDVGRRHGGAWNNAAYVAGKAAQISLVRSAAAEFDSPGVRVSGVAPGMIANPRMKRFLAEGNGPERAQGVIPVDGLVAPEDVADALLFLSSVSASFITGRIFVLDGVQNTWPYPDPGS
ncbi:SDR family oxidoreductase [Streptomyces sp. NPDC002133]|uniref:SDR family NAD(P)-dependent oxidoreductase n=1 Tax=Streptomyces sp. NPDC002133 TaxID=3154409 RepID=UPI0033332AA4